MVLRSIGACKPRGVEASDKYAETEEPVKELAKMGCVGQVRRALNNDFCNALSTPSPDKLWPTLSSDGAIYVDG